MKHALKHIHFVGIGGAGMSAIAEVLHQQGFRVSGSDQTESKLTRRLTEMGVQVHIGHAAAHIAGAQAVVTSTAVQPDNPEVLAARANHVPVVPRGVLLGELMRLKQGIAIAGTHGKTTTTSLTASILAEAGLDPTFVIGGQLLAAGAHSKLGAGEFIVVEADESDASFLHLNPVISVVTNIDADHMETYGHSLERLHGAFVDFLHRLPFYGRAVLCADDAGVRAILPRLQRPVLTYAIEDGTEAGAVGGDRLSPVNFRAVNVRALPGGQMQFSVVQAGRQNLAITLNLAGLHNVRNALAAIAVARELGVADEPIAVALATFAGVGRRFQRHGEVPTADGGRATLIDDYGHHPVEMAAVLAAARGAFPGRRLVLAFQPHRYTRTRDCLADFAAVLQGFDRVLLAEVYAAGEAAIAGADSRTLALAVPGAVFVGELAEMPAALHGALKGGDVLITMGAGSIAALPQQLLQGEGAR